MAGIAGSLRFHQLLSLSEALALQPYALQYGRLTDCSMSISQRKNGEILRLSYLFNVQWMTKWRRWLLSPQIIL